MQITYSGTHGNFGVGTLVYFPDNDNEPFNARIFRLLFFLLSLFWLCPFRWTKVQRNPIYQALAIKGLRLSSVSFGKFFWNMVWGWIFNSGITWQDIWVSCWDRYFAMKIIITKQHNAFQSVFLIFWNISQVQPSYFWIFFDCCNLSCVLHPTSTAYVLRMSLNCVGVQMVL